jgi:multimeric flavodoxin WrbA
MSELRKKVRLKVYGNWWGDHVSLEQANELHMENVRKLKEAFEARSNPDRPIHILGIVGSSRTRDNCAHETSNSAVVLERAMRGVEDQGCTTHVDCYPVDDMQEVYAQMVLADAVLISTGVHEFLPSSRLKLFIDRLISMDGGRFAPKYNVDGETWKNAESKNAEQNVSWWGDFPYQQRLAGKVMGLFVTCKDFGSDKVAMDVVGAFNAYGMALPPNGIAVWNSPRVEKDTAFDKSDLLSALDGWFGQDCETVVRSVVEMAKLVRDREQVFAKTMTGRA